MIRRAIDRRVHDKRRAESHVRFKSPVRRSQPSMAAVTETSTLTPPPSFESEAQVESLEWWLDAHMKLASNMLCLEQLVDGIRVTPMVAKHVEMVRGFIADIEAVRDALYEVYCDAADARMAPVVSGIGPVPNYIRAIYSWCDANTEMLMLLTSGLRVQRPDWAAVRQTYRGAAQLFLAAPRALRGSVLALPIDTKSPVEPLRHALAHVDALALTIARLQDGLANHFG
jgi:hypothetical protein